MAWNTYAAWNSGADEAKKDKIKKENAVTDQDEKHKIVHSRRRQADLHNMRLSFLRQEKAKEKMKKEKLKRNKAASQTVAKTSDS